MNVVERSPFSPVWSHHIIVVVLIAVNSHAVMLVIGRHCCSKSPELIFFLFFNFSVLSSGTPVSSLFFSFLFIIFTLKFRRVPEFFDILRVGGFTFRIGLVQ